MKKAVMGGIGGRPKNYALFFIIIHSALPLVYYDQGADSFLGETEYFYYP
jgi:hypothetical protein